VDGRAQLAEAPKRLVELLSRDEIRTERAGGSDRAGQVIVGILTATSVSAAAP
jgi:hypothetical protein